MSGRSSATSLAYFMYTAPLIVCNQGKFNVVCFYLSKSFGVIDHTILLKELSGSGMRVTVFQWVSSCLSGREKCVYNAVAYSDLYGSPSGVPERSVLSQLLFILFANNVSSAVSNSSILQSADDIKLYKKISFLFDCYMVEQGVHGILLWYDANPLVLNGSRMKVETFNRKTSLVHFSYQPNSRNLCNVFNNRDLGVFFYSKPVFELHIKMILFCALKIFGIISGTTR